MEHKVKVMDPDQLIPQLLKLLEEVPSVPLVISGDSMSPFLQDGRDTVYLSKLTEDPQRGDMILYRRDNGTYILHRIYEITGATYTLIGDGQVSLEPGIRRDQMLAIVSAVRRNGQLLEPGNLCWEFYEKIWLRLLPLRPRIRGICARIRKFL